MIDHGGGTMHVRSRGWYLFGGAGAIFESDPVWVHWLTLLISHRMSSPGTVWYTWYERSSHNWSIASPASSRSDQITSNTMDKVHLHKLTFIAQCPVTNASYWPNIYVRVFYSLKPGTREHWGENMGKIMWGEICWLAITLVRKYKHIELSMFI